MTIDTTEIARQFMQALPHAAALGIDVISATPGEVEMIMPYDERFIGDPGTGVIHGGAVFALLDTCCGTAVLTHPEQKGATATIDLRVDYMRPATPGQAIRVKATCYNMTRTVAFARAVATDERDDKPVAMASGAFVAGV